MSSVRYSACILAVNAWSKAAGEAVFAGWGNPPACGHRVSWVRYCTLLVVGVGVVCCTKCEGGWRGSRKGEFGRMWVSGWVR